MTSASTLQGLLARLDAFRGVEDALLAEVTAQARPCSCAAGHELLVANQLPSQFYAVVEGRARLLHHDPGVRRPLTLALSHPGDLVGWAGLVRRYPCEWVTASTDLKLIAIPADCFYRLECESSSFRDWLDRSSSPSEFIQVLEPSLRRRPHAEPDEREVMRRLLPHMQVCSFRDQLPTLDPASRWFWNCSTQSVGLEVYSDQLDPSLLHSERPLRFVRIDARAFQSAMEPPIEATEEFALAGGTVPWQGDRYADLAPIAAPTSTDPVAGHNVQLTAELSRLPVVTGVGPVDQTMACLQMLATSFNIPFRRDVMERICRQELRERSPSLGQIAGMTAVMGFQPTLLNLPSAQVPRAQTPCLAIIRDQPAMIYSIEKGEVLAVLPEFGRVRLTLDEWIGDQPGVQLLAVTPGRDAQQRKLGFRWFLPQLRKYRRSLIEVLVASLVMQLLSLASPLIIQQIIDKVIAQQNLDTLYVLGALLLAVAAFQGIISAVRTYLFADTTNRIDIALGGEVIQHLLRLPLRYFDKRPVGELTTRIAELGTIRSFLTGTAITLLLDSLFSVIYIAVMVFYSGVLTVVSLGVVPLFLGLTLVASPLIRGQLRKAAERNAATQSQLVEALNGVQTIKAQNAEVNMRWRWQRNYSAYMTENFRTLLIGVSSGTVGNFLNELTGLLTLWVGAFLVIQGDLTIGQLIAFRIISGYVVSPLLRLATSWQSFQQVALSIERLSDVVDAQAEGESDAADLLPLPPVAGDVAFQDVDFRFDEAAPLVAKNVSFEIPSGSFVGIVGRSGSGKSTIMKLLPRLYEPEKGRILLDGYDIAKLELGSVRRQIGIVPQDSLLFDGSVRENIILTCPDATPEEITAAAKVACAHDFIMDLPQGYGTRVGERGSALSGGQRQRIAIARAVLQKPRLLILDEATSALDYITERQVCLNLKKAFEGSTVFFITHRLSTIRSADQILMMDQGALVEMGSHKELIDQQGRYYALYSQQEVGLD